MRRTATIVMAALVVVSMAAVPISGLAATGDVGPADQHTDDSGSDTNATDSDDATVADNETEVGDTETESDENETVADNETDDGDETDGNATVAPGERLAGIVGVQEAELEGAVDGRAFGIAVANAMTNESKAGVVAEQFDSIQERIAELEARNESLHEAYYENGSISEGRFRAQLAALNARMETAKALANQTENETSGLPADLLESKGISATAIQTLKEQASELGGPQVAEIARSIAGQGVGRPAGIPGAGGPGGPPGIPGGENTTDGAAPVGPETPGGPATPDSGGPNDEAMGGNETDGGGTDGNATDGSETDGTTTEQSGDDGDATSGSSGTDTAESSGDDGGDGGGGGESGGGGSSSGGSAESDRSGR